MENPLDTLPESSTNFTAQDNHNHDGVNSPLIDAINLPHGGLTLIKYIESVSQHIDFTSLDLNKDKGYRLIINFDSANFQDEPSLRFNNDSTYQGYYGNYEFPAGSSLSSSGASNYLSLSAANINAAQIDLLILKPGELNFLCTGTITLQNGKQANVPGGNFRLFPVQLSGAYFGANINSINLYVPTFNSMSWKTWLYKLNTQ